MLLFLSLQARDILGLSPPSFLQLYRKRGAFRLYLLFLPGHPCPSLGVAGLPSNLFVHILFKADSGPSEQLPSLATQVPSNLLIQITWLGTVTSFGLLPCGCWPASS